MEENNITRKGLRFWSIIIVLASFSLLVLIRFFLLAINNKDEVKYNINSDQRGLITDRYGRILAIDSPVYNIAIWKPSTTESNYISKVESLVPIIGLSIDDLKNKWLDSKTNFFYIAKKISEENAKAIEAVKEEKKFSALVIEKISGRLYPEKNLASHLIGFVGAGNKGLSGIEYLYDEELRGLNQAKDKSATTKNKNLNVELTIDSDIQFSLEKIADRVYETTMASAIIFLAADAKNAEILAYVNKPDFDPNNISDYTSTDFYDWVTSYAYEPGSVFKIFTMASVLDLGGITENTNITSDGAYRFTAPNGEKIVIKDTAPPGQYNLKKILELSSNAGAGYASDRISIKDFYTMLTKFGFGQKTNIGLPGETSGYLVNSSKWSLRSKPTIAIGQEVLVSAVQVIQASTAIANAGLMYKPSVVRRLYFTDKQGNPQLQPLVSKPIRRVISEESANTILKAMEAAASAGGTAWRGAIKDIKMSMKTGTAQVIDPNTLKYSETDYIISTIAIFPSDNPQIILYLVIVKPQIGAKLGSVTAAPVIGEGADAILNLSDMKRGLSPIIEHSGRIMIELLKPVSIGSKMPDLIGTPKRLLLSLILRNDINVTINGYGYVVAQSPPPGTLINPGTKIHLELK